MHIYNIYIKAFNVFIYKRIEDILSEAEQNVFSQFMTKILIKYL